MIVTKLDIQYDVKRLWQECIGIIGRYGWGDVGQINLTGTNVFTGVGSLHGTGLRENDFITLNQEFCGGYIEEVLRSIPFKTGRFRVMRSRPRTCYSVHKDTTMRLHLPMVTNSQALMIFPDEPLVVHLPANGFVYLTDTRMNHTAMNGGLEDRVHLVGALWE